MATMAREPAKLRPFTVIGYSVADDTLCPTCLPRTTPLTTEKLSHVCRRGPRPVPDSIRKRILELDQDHTWPTRIAAQLGITLPTVMRVLSGDDTDAGTCPACEASKRSEQREIIPLYFGDATVQDETCTYCQHRLVDLALDHHAQRAIDLHVECVTDAKGHPALQFERRPADNIRDALKRAGWRWSPRERLWADYSRTAEMPAGIAAPPKPRVVTARPPIIRKAATREPTVAAG